MPLKEILAYFIFINALIIIPAAIIQIASGINMLPVISYSLPFTIGSSLVIYLFL